jgi:hypothetical protein
VEGIMKRAQAALVALLVTIAVVMAWGGFYAQAQTVPGLPFGGASSSTGAGNPYDGKGEQFQTWTGTLSTTALGTICTATTAARVSIKTFVITCATAQAVDIYDGTTIQGSSVLAHIYVPSNTPTKFTRDDLGTGLTGSLGNAMTILGGSTGACYITYCVQRPLN